MSTPSANPPGPRAGAQSTEPDLRHRLFELIRFGMVGGFSTVLYFAVYSGLTLLDAPLVLASAGGFAVSITFGFVLHHRFTFRTGSTGPQGFGRWALLQGSVLALNVGALSVLVHVAKLDRIVAQLILLPLIPLLTFFLSRRLVFTPPS